MDNAGICLVFYNFRYSLTGQRFRSSHLNYLGTFFQYLHYFGCQISMMYWIGAVLARPHHGNNSLLSENYQIMQASEESGRLNDGIRKLRLLQEHLNPV